MKLIQCLCVCFRLIALLIFSNSAVAADQSRSRLALVFGNSAYASIPSLRNPRNDATAVAAKLEQLGFRVILGVDLDRQQMADAIRQFSRSLDNVDVALFYYAGHGAQINGENLIIPVNADVQHESDIPFGTIKVKTILDQMERSPRVNLIFLDACRDNPFLRKLVPSAGTRSFAAGRGLAKIKASEGTMIVYATQPDNVALDGEGKHSPFTAAFLQHVEAPGLDIALLMRRVRIAVKQATNNKQVPWSSSSLIAPFSFTPASLGKLKIMSDSEAERTFWETVKASTHEEELQSYLTRYPNGIYRTLAKLRIDQIADNIKRISKRKHNAEFRLVREMQRDLNRLNCISTLRLEVDGVWGDKSREALRRFFYYSRERQYTTVPTKELRDLLRRQREGVCWRIFSVPMHSSLGKRANKATASYPFSTKVMTAKGAPGDGNTILASQLRHQLRAQGVMLAPKNAAHPYSVRIKFKVSELPRKRQIISIEWDVFSPTAELIYVAKVFKEISEKSSGITWDNSNLLSANEAGKDIGRYLAQVQRGKN